MTNVSSPAQQLLRRDSRGFYCLTSMDTSAQKQDDTRPGRRATNGTAHRAGRTVIVTGANTGIGLHTASLLHSAGNHVVLACRSVRKGGQAVEAIMAQWVASHATANNEARAQAAARLSVEELDLSSLQSVAQFARRWYSVAPLRPVHGLVLNAGVNGFGGIDQRRTKEVGGHVCVAVCGSVGSLSHHRWTSTAIQGINMVYGVNFVGHAALTLWMLDALRASGPSGARVVALSSTTHRTADGNFTAAATTPGAINYGNSKLALTVWGIHLQRLLNTCGITNVVCVSANPGSVASDIWRRLPRVAQWVIDHIMLSPVQVRAATCLPTRIVCVVVCEG